MAGTTIWITNLQATARAYEALERKNLQLHIEMACLDGEEVLGCWQREQLEIAESKAAAELKLMNDSLAEQGRLARDIAGKQLEIDGLDAWRQEHLSDDGALPKNVMDYYARLRPKAGVK